MPQIHRKLSTQYTHAFLVSVIIVMCLLASYAITDVVIQYRLHSSGEKAEQIFLRELNIAATNLKNTKTLLTGVNATSCSDDVVTALERYVYKSGNHSVVWAHYGKDTVVCSIIGATEFPSPNYYRSFGYIGQSLEIFQMRNNLNLEAYLPVYVNMAAADLNLYVQLGSTLELRTLLDLKDIYTQLEVYLDNDLRLFNLNPLADPGQTYTYESPKTGLTFTLTKDVHRSYQLMVIVFTLLIFATFMLLQFAKLTTPKIRSTIWHLRFQQAFRSNKFFLVYQPIYDLKEHKAIGVEVLLRWQDNRGSVRDTGDFIEILEHDPMMPKVTRWVIETAFKELAPIMDCGQLRWFSVNVSAKDIEEGELLNYLLHLKQLDYPLHQLSLELTERIPVTQWHVLQHFIQTTRAIGCKIKLDDAGTGYGGSLYIQELDFDYLKIDREFVRRIGTDDRKSTLIQSYRTIAHDIGIDVIAEGVNDSVQAEYLYQMGITMQQGWLYAKGLTQQELANYVKTTSLGIAV